MLKPEIFNGPCTLDVLFNGVILLTFNGDNNVVLWFNSVKPSTFNDD